jgi:AraC family transcriptional regulator
LAKIAPELQQALTWRDVNGAAGTTSARRLAQGDGWTVSDVVCTCGPRDRRFEEHHVGFTVTIITAGSFQYRAADHRELMTPGSILLGNAGQTFECGHDHGRGDRCLSFGYTPAYFERLAADAGVRRGKLDFRVLRLPPLRALSALIARACAGVSGSLGSPWEELSLQISARAVQLERGLSPNEATIPASSIARVTRSVRMIEAHPNAKLTLATLAREAGLSSYHFLRTFQQLTGVTPHQFVLRTRLREAARRLAASPAKILDIALDCGFGDVSNFNHAFRTEFGVSPRAYRTTYATACPKTTS